MAANVRARSVSEGASAESEPEAPVRAAQRDDQTEPEAPARATLTARPQRPRKEPP
jgi:hypothetical protein